MSATSLPPHLLQANSWKRLLNERLQSFSEWDEGHQILSSVAQSSLYKMRQQLRSDTFHIANVAGSYDMIVRTHDSLAQRLREVESEIQGLQNNAPQEASQAIKQARNSLRVIVEQYNKQVLSLETSHRLLQSQRTAMLAPIGYSVLKRQVEFACDALLQDKLKLNIGRTVNHFLDDVDSNVQNLEHEIERVNIVLISIYERSEQHKNNAGSLASKLLNITPQRTRLQQLYKKASNFRFSLATVFTSKSALVDRFMSTLVQDVRTIYLELNEAIDGWIKEALSSLVQTNQYQKHMIDNQKQRLAQLEREGSGTQPQIAELQASAHQLQVALRSLQPLYEDVVSAQQAAVDSKNSLAEVVQAQVVSLQEVRQAVAVS